MGGVALMVINHGIYILIDATSTVLAATSACLIFTSMSRQFVIIARRKVGENGLPLTVNILACTGKNS